MNSLTPLSSIQVPIPKADEEYELEFSGRKFSFQGLKKLLGAADYTKAGDRNAGLSSQGECEREAARSILSSLTLQHLYDRPLLDDQGRVDSVMRVNYDINLDLFRQYSAWTLGAVKNHLLHDSITEAKKMGPALTGVMAAALAKLMDTHELILIAKKINHPTQARTQLGLRGTLSSRLQPNHPVDDLRSLSLLVYAGLSMGSGDALIGVNPAIDTVENISAILNHLDYLRRETGAPTQICVLSHIKTQLACLAGGAPVEVIFQSLAGTEATNLTEFDITVDLLDRAYLTMKEKGPLREIAKQFMYFETGQGSEFTYGKHQGIDMTTTEALCYGLARRYDPFMVNNVTGFIGPETHLDNFEMIISNLQDHFMGKLLGLPMGMAPCYTLHSKITLEGQQMATQLLTAAGANYYMDVYLNTDRMLAYFDTSAHDNQTLREIYNKTPAPQFLAWALEKGIFAKSEENEMIRGPHWGNPRIFCPDESKFQELLQSTPALYGLQNAGPRPANEVSRKLKSNHAVGREAIYKDLDIEALRTIADFKRLKTTASDRESHLNSPTLGAILSVESSEWLKRAQSLNKNLTPSETCTIQMVVSDGLSAEAVHANLKELYPVIQDGLSAKSRQGHQFTLGQPLLIPFGRVKVGEQIAECLNTDLTLLLIGERPGGDAAASTSLSAYFIYQLKNQEVQKRAAIFNGNENIKFEYTVISNIYSGGIPPIEAGSLIVEKVSEILKHSAAGNRLESYLKKGAVNAN